MVYYNFKGKMDSHKHSHKTSIAGLLVALGIIYGDIGTSPLYVMKAIGGERAITPELILGGLSCIIWTLILQTTIKYVLITLRADNNGEGGIFSLYTLVRRRRPYLIFPAIIGGGALLAEAILTPPITVASAIEGLEKLNPNIPTIPIVVVIISILFFIQRVGTSVVGKAFGPIMFVWFIMLGVLGASSISLNPSVLLAFNPYYGIKLLVHYPNGFWLLGAVFLCTTGAEALYSDLGHCGRQNIQIGWFFVLIMLFLNYLGQSAWLLNQTSLVVGVDKFGEAALSNPFYEIMPKWFILPGVIISTLASVIASQAVISGSFTLIAEAVKLNVWPKVKIKYPTEMKGQLYVPSANLLLWIGCLVVVWYFQKSVRMEAAYGLTIIVSMMMTTTLLTFYLINNKVSVAYIALFLLVYTCIETAFFIANMEKFVHGGWVSLTIALSLITVMWIWFRAKLIKTKHILYDDLKDFLPALKELSHDHSIPKFATHLVYLTGANRPNKIEQKIIYSIMERQPKRAEIYWFVHVDVVDDPYKMEYKVEIIAPNDVIRVDFKLGFRVPQKISYYFKKILEELIRNEEIDIHGRYFNVRDSKKIGIGDYTFVLLKRHLSYDNTLSIYEKSIMDGYNILNSWSLSADKAYGLDSSNVYIEQVPLVIHPAKHIINLKRVYDKET